MHIAVSQNSQFQPHNQCALLALDFSPLSGSRVVAGPAAADVKICPSEMGSDQIVIALNGPAFSGLDDLLFLVIPIPEKDDSVKKEAESIRDGGGMEVADRNRDLKILDHP